MPIDPNLVAALVFAAVALVIAGGLFVARQTESASGASPAATTPHVRLAEGEQALASANPVDRWMANAVRESGWHQSLETIAWLMLCAGTLTAGVLWIWREDWLLAAGGFVAGAAVVAGALVVARLQRRRRLAEQLPDAADMLARAIRAGESLDQSLASVARKTPEPLAGELRRAVQQIELGLPVNQALAVLDRRMRLTEMRIFVAPMAMHRQTGGNLAAMLDRLANTMRSRARYRRRIRSATAAARFAALMLAVAGPLVFLYMLYDRTYSHSLFESSSGQYWLMVAAGLELIGLAWVVALLQTDVS